MSIRLKYMDEASKFAKVQSRRWQGEKTRGWMIKARNCFDPRSEIQGYHYSNGKSVWVICQPETGFFQDVCAMGLDDKNEVFLPSLLTIQLPTWLLLSDETMKPIKNAFEKRCLFVSLRNQTKPASFTPITQSVSKTDQTGFADSRRKRENQVCKETRRDFGLNVLY